MYLHGVKQPEMLVIILSSDQTSCTNFSEYELAPSVLLHIGKDGEAQTSQ